MLIYKNCVRASILFFSLVNILHAATTTTELLSKNNSHIKEKISFDLQPSEVIYKDFISFSVDHPAISVKSWEANISPINQYVAELGTTKPVFNRDFHIIVELRIKENKKIENATLHAAYQSSAHQKTQELVIPLKFEHTQPTETKLPESMCDPVTPTEPQPAPKTLNLTSWSTYLENLIKTTDLLIVRILLIALLGLLMSFTPCIYPMIPITIGIMQGQKNSSVLRSFLHAFFYSIGIATTFAALGLLAALSGTIFGMLLTNPIVVLLIVAMLVYLAGSMFGFYEMRIPTFLKEKNREHKASLFSSFLFGALSGTVASPCLSPGLALVLCIVASLGNAFLGFLLLFAFGIGLSIPLLIIGTFSNALNVMPRAGAWMIEVKKIFGFLLLGMSFYYLKNIIDPNILLWAVALFCTLSGLYYLFVINAHDSKLLKRIKILIGALFLAGGIHLFFQAYGTLGDTEHATDSFWTTDYKQAFERAVQEKKFMFLDFWAPSCSICTAIDKTLLKDADVRAALNKFVPAKLELVMSDPVIMNLKQQFNIIGLPTFILFDPIENTVVKRWGGELYRADKKAFIEDLQSALR